MDEEALDQRGRAVPRLANYLRTYLFTSVEIVSFYPHFSETTTITVRSCSPAPECRILLAIKAVILFTLRKDENGPSTSSALIRRAHEQQTC